MPELLIKLLLPFRLNAQVAPVTVPPLVSEQLLAKLMLEPVLKLRVLPELTVNVEIWSNVDVPLTASVPEPANVIPDAL